MAFPKLGMSLRTDFAAVVNGDGPGERSSPWTARKLCPFQKKPVTATFGCLSLSINDEPWPWQRRGLGDPKLLHECASKGASPCCTKDPVVPRGLILDYLLRPRYSLKPGPKAGIGTPQMG